MSPIPMRRRRPGARLSLLLTLLLSAQAQAQVQMQAPTTTRSDPLDAKAPVPSLRYESAFTQFRSFRDGNPVAWREANDAVARIGGWRVYTREAHQPDPAAAEKPAAPAQAPAVQPAPVPEPTAKPAPVPSPAGHSGHKH